MRVERCVVAYDIGRAVNPVLVEGQIAGGAAQGIGGALLEEFVYDAHGQPLAASFVDYLLPTSAEVPPIEALLLEDAPSPLNPLGVKGAGEAGINGMGAAIAGAVDDAIGIPGAITRLPITPCRLHTLLAARRSWANTCRLTAPVGWHAASDFSAYRHHSSSSLSRISASLIRRC